MRRLVGTDSAVISRRRRCLFCVTMIVSAFGGQNSPVPAQPKPIDDRAWLHIYVRDRRLTNAYETVQQLIQQGRQEVGVGNTLQPAVSTVSRRGQEVAAQLQFIFEQPYDAWMLTDEGRLRSVREETQQLLRDQAPFLLREYERVVYADATQELARARASEHPSDYLRVVRHYFATGQGYFAAEWLIKHWLDDGNWRMAADLACQMIYSPFHEERLHPRFLKMGIVACELAERSEDVTELRRRLLQKAEAGNPQFAEETARWLNASIDHRPRKKQPDFSAPIPDPLWQQPLESVQSRLHVEASLTEWAASQSEHDQSSAVGWMPLRIGPLIVFRELDLIRAVDAGTGETAWRYHTASNLGSLLNPADQDGSLRRYRSSLWEAAAANSLISGLSTDGRRIFAIESSDSLTLAGVLGLESQFLAVQSRRETVRNELIALDLQAAGGEPKLLWRTGSTPDMDRLRNHAFLGPPLANGNTLFAISEADREICVSALDIPSGRILWQQPIAVAERSVVEDRGRSLRACQPTLSKNLLICPTNIGILVALDVVDGTLRWVHNSLENDSSVPTQPFRNYTPLVQRHHSAFPSDVKISETALVYLPSQSDDLYCLDSATGMERWRIADADAQYLEVTESNQVIAVGHSAITCYSLDNGSRQWVCTLESVVSGMGVVVKNSYLVPLESGQIANIDLQSGRSRGFQFDLQTQPVGHLVLTADAVISVGAKGIAAFPQSHAVLARLTAGSASTASPQTAIKIAEVRLAEGQLEEAADILQSAWSVLPDGRDKQQARKLLWETYFQLVRENREQAAKWIQALKPLLNNATEAEKSRWLVTATAHSLQDQDWTTLLPQMQQLAEQSTTQLLIESPRDRDLEISGAVWLHQILQELNDDQKQQFADYLTSQALPNPTATVGRIAAMILDETATGELKLAQARAYVRDRQWHQAAHLYLQVSRLGSHRRPGEADDTNASRSRLAHIAIMELASLYADANLVGTAARTINRLPMSTAGRLQLWRQAAPASSSLERSQAYEAVRRYRPVDWDVRNVEISSRKRKVQVTDFTEETSRQRKFTPYEDYQRTVGNIPAQSALEWLLRNTERGTEIGVFDKISSRKVMEVVLPFGASPPGSLASPANSQMIPFSLPGEIRALSPLQGHDDFVAWKVALPEWTRRSGQALCGPSTLTTTCFQWRNVLMALDPADGRLLWRRNDIEPNAGMYADSRIGLLADDETLFLLGADKLSYQLIDMRTGQVRSRGKLDQDIRFARYALGSRILHLSDDGQVRRFRLWDPGSNQLVLDDTLRSRQLFSRFNDDGVAWLSADAHLRIYSTAADAIVVDVPLTEAETYGASTLKVAQQDGRYYVSISRNQPVARTTHFHLQVADKLIAGEGFRDDLLAISPNGKEILWRKTIPQRSILEFEAPGLPFLIAGSLVRDKRDQNRRWLRFEAIDRDTGLLLGVGDLLENDRLLAVDYDGINGHITLLGRNTEIDFDFSRQRQRSVNGVVELQ